MDDKTEGIDGQVNRSGSDNVGKGANTKVHSTSNMVNWNWGIVATYDAKPNLPLLQKGGDKLEWGDQQSWWQALQVPSWRLESINYNKEDEVLP